MPLGLVAGLLFLSGMCGLIFQVSWFREFRLVFGASTAASSAVLAVFMGGLGIGNAVLGKRADQSKNPLAFYAFLELSIALMSAVSPLLIDVLHGFYISMGGQQAMGFSAATGVRLAISFLVMGIPTFLMGGTPARGRSGCGDGPRRSAASPTRDAVWDQHVGSGRRRVCQYVLCARIFRHTRNALAGQSREHIYRALRVWAFAPSVYVRMTQESQGRHAATATHSEELCGPPPVPASMVYAVAGIVGFAFFLMELVWYRMLGPILGGSTFTFGLILAVALTGIGLGGVAYALFFKQRGVSVQGLAITCLLEAVCIGLPFALGDRIAIFAARLHGNNTGQFLGGVAGWAVIACHCGLACRVCQRSAIPAFHCPLGPRRKGCRQTSWLGLYLEHGGSDFAGRLPAGSACCRSSPLRGLWRMVASLMAILGLCVLGSLLATRKHARAETYDAGSRDRSVDHDHGAGANRRLAAWWHWCGAVVVQQFHDRERAAKLAKRHPPLVLVGKRKVWSRAWPLAKQIRSRSTSMASATVMRLGTRARRLCSA